MLSGWPESRYARIGNGRYILAANITHGFSRAMSEVRTTALRDNCENSMSMPLGQLRSSQRRA